MVNQQKKSGLRGIWLKNFAILRTKTKKKIKIFSRGKSLFANFYLCAYLF